uniref:Uncharacterized protein n=1 Tax=viral metagenome TaxID=1070528 RepID=A0A6M3ITK3_9ZZZZ
MQSKYKSLSPLDGRDIQTCIDELSDESHLEMTKRMKRLMTIRNMGESGAAECIGAVARYTQRKHCGVDAVMEYLERQ